MNKSLEEMISQYNLDIKHNRTFLKFYYSNYEFLKACDTDKETLIKNIREAIRFGVELKYILSNYIECLKGAESDTLNLEELILDVEIMKINIKTELNVFETELRKYIDVYEVI